jgi:hypothetical protein
MANASKKHFGPGSQGKGAGVGGLTDVPKQKIGENMVLSNRDKKLHSADRGQDSKECRPSSFKITTPIASMTEAPWLALR